MMADLLEPDSIPDLAVSFGRLLQDLDETNISLVNYILRRGRDPDPALCCCCVLVVTRYALE